MTEYKPGSIARALSDAHEEVRRLTRENAALSNQVKSLKADIRGHRCGVDVDEKHDNEREDREPHVFSVDREEGGL